MRTQGASSALDNYVCLQCPAICTHPPQHQCAQQWDFSQHGAGHADPTWLQVGMVHVEQLWQQGDVQHLPENSAGHGQPHLPWEGTYWGAAGLPGQDTSCLLFGHVEILQVGVVDVLGESFQVSHLWVLAADLARRQPCHQLPLLCLWHAPKADCWGAKLGVRTAGGLQEMHSERQQFVLPLQTDRSAGEHLQLRDTMLLQATAPPALTNSQTSHCCSLRPNFHPIPLGSCTIPTSHINTFACLGARFSHLKSESPSTEQFCVPLG